MVSAVTLVHAVEGRMRLKVADVKGDSARAQTIEGTLRTFPGVLKAKANPVTGSVLLYYDARRIGRMALLDLLTAIGPLGPSVMARADAVVTRSGRFCDKLAETLICSTMEFAVHRLMRALI